MAEIYRGELRKKLSPKKEGKKLAAALVGNDDELRALIRAEIDEQYKKLPALFKHFKIKFESDSHDEFFELAIRLAEAHVPGFQYEQARGAPKKWDYTKRVEAALELGKLKEKNPGKSDNHLASILHKHEPWSSLSKTPTALLKQIRLQKREAVMMKEVHAEKRVNSRLVALSKQGNK